MRKPFPYQVFTICLCWFLVAIYSHDQGKYIHNKFPIGNLTFTWSEFKSVCCDYLARIVLVWCSVFPANVHYKKQTIVAAILTSLTFVDYLIEGNVGWFDIPFHGVNYVMSFDAVIGALYGVLSFIVLIRWFNGFK